MTLNRNGLMGRYIRFISISNYYPNSFCILFWYLVFSPIIGIKNYIIHGIALVEKRYRNNIQKKHNLEVEQLVERYKNDPELFMTDYHIWTSQMTGYYLSSQRLVVRDALTKYRDTFQHLDDGEYGISWRSVLKHLNLCQTRSDVDFWWEYNAYEAKELVCSRCEPITPPIKSHPLIDHYLIQPKGFWIGLLGSAVILLPLFWALKGIVVFCTFFFAIIGLFLFIATWIYLNINTYISAMYQMFIKKACPTIEWK